MLTNMLFLLGSLPQPGGEWPFIRGDVRNTGASAVVGRMTQAPEVLARYSLGGAPLEAVSGSGAGWISATAYLLADLDRDGLEEIITVAGGPVQALQGSGKVLWRTLLPQGRPYLLAAADLDRDGVPEVICSSGPPATIHILSGRDGRLLWEKSFEEQVYFTNGTRVADLDGDGGPELFILGNAPAENSRRVGWAYRFARGFAEPELLWGGRDMPLNPHYRPQTIVADIDADGRPEIVVASAVHANGKGLMVAALDALTGEVKRAVDFANGDRNYGHLQAIRVPGKPQLDLLVIGMLGRSHITYLTNDAQGMREAWHVNATFQIPCNPVADVDGDGKLEVVYTQVSDSGGPPTVVDTIITVRDLATGQMRGAVAGVRLMGMADLDGDGVTDLVATTVPDSRIVLYAGTDKQKALDTPGARLCLIADRPPITMMNESLAERSGYNVFARDIDGDGAQELFVRTPGAIVAVSGKGKQAAAYRFGQDGPAELVGTGRLWDPKAEALLLSGETGLVVAGMGGKPRARVAVHDHPPHAIVAARLGRDAAPAVLACRADGTVAALDGPALAQGRIRELWALRQLAGFEAPTVADVDGDGRAEVILCDTTTAEPVIVDARGHTKQRLPALPTDGTPLVTGTCVVGRFGQGGKTMVAAVSEVGPNDGIAKWTMIDPASGQAVWQREGGPHPRRTACVYDVNGDGRDDLVYVHYFDLMAVDGATGANVWALPGSVPGYHLATVTDLDGSGNPSILLSGGYAAIYRFDLRGQEVWRTPPLNYNAGSAAAVADADGDGKPEFGTAFTDRFECCDAATGKVKLTVPLPGKGSDVAAADVDGDGRAEFLFGCTDGNLYAVKAPREVLWKVNLEAPVGPPSIADINGDGQAEVLVSTQDGWLHVLAARR